MKAITYILGVLLIVVSHGCADTKPLNTFQLCFVEQSTRNPIATSNFVLIPRRILLKISRNYRGGDPNLQFAETITTDQNGFVSVTKEQIDNLTLDGKVVIDCMSDHYSRFLIRKNQIPQEKGSTYSITVFSTGNNANYHVTLEEGKEHVISLEKRERP